MMRPLLAASSAALFLASNIGSVVITIASGRKMTSSLRHRRTVTNHEKIVDFATHRRVEELDPDDRQYWNTLLRQELSFPITPMPVPVSPSPRPPTSPVSTPPPLPTRAPVVVTPSPSPEPTADPTTMPTLETPITVVPTTQIPITTPVPTSFPTTVPIDQPTPRIPTPLPTNAPITTPPTSAPTLSPTFAPTEVPTIIPMTSSPTIELTVAPTLTPSSRPTIAPTNSPTEAPSNMPSILGQCSLSAIADCVVLPDRSPCSTLSQLSDDQLSCSSPPSQLGWVYTGRNCGFTNPTRVGFSCQDSNGGPTSSVVVYMVVRGTNTQEEYFSGLLFRMMGGLPVSSLIMSSGDPDVILDSSVDVILTRSNMEGEILQSMTIPTSCGEDVDQLTLGKKFGSIEFDSYRSDESGLVKGSQQVQWEYTVFNEGNVDSEITSVMTITAGDMADLMPTDDVVLEDGEDFQVPVEKTVSLVESGVYSGAVNFTAVSAEGDCSASAMSSFTIS